MDQPKSLKDLIKDAGMTYDHLAERLGVDKSQISYWNSRKKVPRLDNAVRIARELGVSLLCLTQALGIDVDGIPPDCRDEKDVN